MLFKRSRPAASPPTSSTVPPASAPATGDAEIAQLLDVIGSLTATYIRGCFDLPRFPAEESQQTLSAWRRHAVLGVEVGPVQVASNATSSAPSQPPDGAQRALPTAQRDWRGVTGAFAEHRSTERHFVERALTDLRETLWLCIERSYQSLLADTTTDGEHEQQLARVRAALEQLETGTVKQEITSAMTAMQEATRARQGAQRALYQELTASMERLGEQLEEARRQGETDALTGLGNRLAFDRAISRQTALHGLGGASLSLLMIDLDLLKPINDRLGHAAGDEALVAVSNVLHRVFLGDNDQLCRIGGDEFAVVLPDTGEPLAARLAERLQTALSAEPWPHAESGLALSISVGAAEWKRGEPVSEWLARADAAMYANKAARRAAA